MMLVLGKGDSAPKAQAQPEAEAPVPFAFGRLRDEKWGQAPALTAAEPIPVFIPTHYAVGCYVSFRAPRTVLVNGH